MHPTAPEPPRWYRTKTFLLGLFGFSCLFWLWVDSAQIVTTLVVGSRKPAGYLVLHCGYGSAGFLIQASEPDEVPETMYTRGRTGVGVRGGPRFPARLRMDLKGGGLGISLPVPFLWIGYLVLWLGLLRWRGGRNH